MSSAAPPQARRHSALRNSHSAFARRLHLEPLESRQLLALVSYWSADNTAIDSISGNNGALQNGATYAAGQINQAFKLDGINDRVLVADSPSLAITQSLSIEGWIRVDGYSTTSTGMILFRGDDRGGLDPYVLDIEPSGVLRFGISPADNQGISLLSAIPLGQFVHVAATLDDTTGVMSIYENGVLMSHATTTVRPFGALDPTQHPGLGIGNGNSTYNSPFHGLIDELKVYDSALTADQVLADFNAQKGSLQPTISISDASATEGQRTEQFVGAFVSAESGGLGHARNVLFGPDGNLYVASRDTDSVLRYDGNTGAFLDTFVSSGSGVLSQPWAMAFGPDGNLFVSSPPTNSVLRYDGATGALIDQFIPSGSFGLSQPKGLVFGSDGSLYVSSTTGGGGIAGPHQVLRFQGPLSGSPGAPLPAPGQAGAVFVTDGSGGLSNPNGLAFGPDGNLYVTSTFQDTVNRYDAATGASLGTLVTPNSGGLDAPNYLVFRPDGMLYVTSQSTNSVLRYSASTGAFVDAIVPASSGGLITPAGLAFDASGDLYVGSGSSEVLRYTSLPVVAFNVTLNGPFPSTITINYATASGSATAGTDFVGSSGSITFAPGQMTHTVMVQILDDSTFEPSETFTVNLSGAAGATIADGQGVGTIIDDDIPPTKFYVVNDGSPDRTFEYAASGAAIENYAINSGNTSSRGAASTATGDKVWVVDANKNVYVYNTSGGILGSWSAGSLPANADVQGVTTNGTDVWIVDAKGDKVYKYTGAASRLSGSQTAASSFNLSSTNSTPKDLVTDGTSIWVVNSSGTDRVFKYTASGTLNGKWSIDPANNSPTGITIDPSNVSNIWIVDNVALKIFQYNGTATRISGSQSASATFALSSGNTNPQGIADPPPAAGGNALFTGQSSGTENVVTTGASAGSRFDGTAADDFFGSLGDPNVSFGIGGAYNSGLAPALIGPSGQKVSLIDLIGSKGDSLKSALDGEGGGWFGAGRVDKNSALDLSLYACEAGSTDANAIDAVLELGWAV